MARLQFLKRRRIHGILQTEVAECGIACLAMIASYYGLDTDLSHLRRKFPISQNGLTLHQLMLIGKQLDLSCRPLRVNISHLSAVRLPAILHWDLNHFVVLSKLAGKKYVIHDPARGDRVIDDIEMGRHFTGVLLELSPTQQFQPREEKKKLQIWASLKNTPGLRRALTQLLFLAVTLEFFALISPLFIQLVIDNVVATVDRGLLSLLTVGFLLILFIQVGINAARSWGLLYLGTTLNVQLTKNLFSHLLTLPMDYFEKRHLGDISSRFGSLETLQRTVTTSFLEALIDGVLVVATLALMLIYSQKLAFLSLSAVIVYAFVRTIIFQPLRQSKEDTLIRAAKQNTNFLETVRGIQSIKLFGREMQREAVFENLVIEKTNADIKTEQLEILFRSLNLLIFGIEGIAIIYFGATLILNGELSIGMLYAFIAYKLQFSQKASALTDKFVELRMLGLHAERIADVALTESEISSDKLHNHTIGADIRVENLTFRYSPFEKNIFENLTFNISPGEIVAITGASGCGKTTLIKVLLGLLKPEQGDILVGGSDISQIHPDSYRNIIGTVMQDDVLFTGSIAENIAFFDPLMKEVNVHSAAALANIFDDVVKMPMQFNTLVGNMGSTLSGGQKQRIILARALYRQPKILFLDEATSNLDVLSEQKINAVIRNLDITVVMIAHRPDSVAAADRVINLSNHAHIYPDSNIIGTTGIK